MNFTESFQDFSSKLGPTDLALYAGAGIILWILFKDKLSPVQKLVTDLTNKLYNKRIDSMIVPQVQMPQVVPVVPTKGNADNEDTFFKLVVSWKQTRDLAVKSNCTKAVEVADQMFPYLSPNVCKKEDTK